MRVVMGQGPSGLFTAFSRPLNFLAQNCIRLESSSFRVRPLDFLVQNFRSFTTFNKSHQEKEKVKKVHQIGIFLNKGLCFLQI